MMLMPYLSPPIVFLRRLPHCLRDSLH
ncbi:hypothetical protein Gogos_006163, partial [Gossypium gossypioides]|nr:hypothetical protein [Gossypium gossypioides]